MAGLSRAAGRAADVIAGAALRVLSRPGRAALTIIGVALGVAVLTGAVGISQSAGNRIVSRLETLEPTLIRVEAPPGEPPGFGLSWGSEPAIRRIAGVKSAATAATLGEDVAVSALPSGPANRTARLTVLAASSGLAETTGAAVGRGTFFDPLLDEAPYRAAVLGEGAALSLEMTAFTPGRDAIFIDGAAFPVLGVLSDAGEEPSLSGAVIVSRGALSDPPSPNVIYVRADRGAAGTVAGQLATVANPGHPDRLVVDHAAGGTRLRRDVESDVNALFAALTLVTLAVAALGIANVTLTSVLERRGEIGLRRALGATRARIGMEFLTESSLLGLLGGALGASAGVTATVAAAAVRDWAAVLDGWAVWAGPLLGMLTGLAAGAYPSLRAARLEPTAALRDA